MALITNAATRIDIVVRKESGSLGSDTITSDKSVKENQEEKQESESSSREDRLKKKIIRTAVTHTMSSVLQVGQQTANYITGGIGLYSGDSSYQDYCQRQVEIVTDTVNVASAIGLNTMYGTIYSGGNIGIGLLNGVIGGFSSLSSKYFKYARRHREYDYKVFKENNSIEYNRSRANINLTNGRLR